MPFPVFVGGADRSGTTLLGSLFGNHPRGVCVPEAQFKRSVFQRLEKQGTMDRGTLLEQLRGSFRFWNWSLDESDVRETLPRTIESGEWLKKLALLFGRKHYPSRNEGSVEFFVDHTPNNIRFPRLYGEPFDRVKFIHIVRDGRAVARSVMDQDGGPNTILTAAPYWAERLSHGLATEGFLNVDRVYRVYYEDLVSRTHETMNELCDFLEISFDDRLCGETDYSVSEYTEDQHELVGEAPRPGRAEAWKDELTERQIELFEAETGELLDHFGYTRRYPHTSARPGRWERWKAYWWEQYRTLANKFRYRRRRMKVE